MSDNPKKKPTTTVNNNETTYGTDTGDDDKEVTMPAEIVLVENSEPRTVTALGNMIGTDKKIRTGPKAVLPGAVAQSAVASDRKYPSPAALVRYEKDTEMGKRRSKIAASRRVSVSKVGGNKLVPSSTSDKVETKIVNDGGQFIAPAMVPLGNSEPSAFPSKMVRPSPKASLPGAVAESKAADYGGKRRSKAAVSRGAAGPKTAGNKKRYSFPTDLATNAVDKEGVDADIYIKATRKNEAQLPHVHNDEPQIPVLMNRTKDNIKVAADSNIFKGTFESEDIIVATLVDSNKNLGTDVIVDAIIVDDKPTVWYKDRRNLLIIGIIMIAAILAIALLIRESNGGSVYRSIQPSMFYSDMSTDAPIEIPSLLPSSIRTHAPSLNPSSRLLKEFYDSTGGPSWDIKWNFSSGQSHCKFFGITCDVFNQIIEINVSNNNLRGSLPSMLGLLSSLTGLYVYDNSISGTIPTELAMLSSLAELYLDDNAITGTIPSELGIMSSLEGLRLFRNSINGTIPSELGMLSSITRLRINDNFINGTIPSELGLLSLMGRLYLDTNTITGTIPTELGSLLSMRFLYLQNNNITGAIPSELGKLSSLTRLLLRDNSLMGTLPMELCTLTSTTISYDEYHISCSCVNSSYMLGTTCS